MPVPAPRRPPPNTSTTAAPEPVISLKKRRTSASPASPPLQPLAPSVSVNVNGSMHSYGHTEGELVKPQQQARRRRRTKRRVSVTSTNSGGSATDVSGDLHVDLVKEEVEEEGKEEVVVVGADEDVGAAESDWEEWQGIMKRIVDEWEIPRKVLHTSIGFGVLYLYSTRPDNVQPVIKSLAGALAIIVPTDILRLRSRRFEKVYEKVCGFLMRESERTSSNGVIWYMLGVIYVLALFPRDLAVMAVLILSWCDTAASTFGRMYGRYTWPLPRRLLGLPLAKRKSFAGFAAAVLTGTLIAIGFWGYAVPKWQGYSATAAEQWGKVSWKWDAEEGEGIVNGGWASLVGVGVVTGLISGVVEALDLGSIDDNLSLPVISGTILWGLSKLAEFVISIW